MTTTQAAETSEHTDRDELMDTVADRLAEIEVVLEGLIAKVERWKREGANR